MRPTIGLWVGPGARRRGLGGSALRALLARIPERELVPAHLGTFVDNRSMRRIAERNGGEVIHRGPYRLADGSVADSVRYPFGRVDD